MFKMFKKREIQTIKAIHDRDVLGLFEAWNLKEALIRGEIKCVICGVALTPETFGAVLRKGDKLLFTCDNPECIDAFIRNYVVIQRDNNVGSN